MGDTVVTLIIFLHKYPAVYDNWTTKTEGSVNDFCVVNGSALQFQMVIHH